VLDAGCFAAKDKKCATRASLARRAELLRWAMASDPSGSCEAPGVPEQERFDQREMAGVSFSPLLGSHLWIVKTISGRGQREVARVAPQAELAALFAAVHGGIGQLEQANGVGAVVRRDGIPNGQTDLHLHVVQRKR